MASRSTRRRLKNPEIPKIDENQDEEETDSKQSSVGRRRSLRHSPGSSSISPPHKARRIKESPNAAESKVIKLSTPPKNLKSPTKSPSQGNKVALDDESKILPDELPATKRNTRNSPINLNCSPARTTRNSPLPSVSPKKGSSGKLITNSSETPPRRNTRRTASSPCDKEENDHSKIECTKSRRGISLNMPVQESCKTANPSTSQPRKQSLPQTSELAEKTNGTSPKELPVRSTKRKYRSPVKETQPTSNGKSNDSLPSFKEKRFKSENGAHGSSAPSQSLDHSSPSSSPISASDTSVVRGDDVSPSDIHDGKVKVTSKRRLAEDSSDIIESSCKKYKSEANSAINIDTPTSLSSDNCNSSIQQTTICTFSNLPESNTETTSPIPCESSHTLSNVEQLLIKECGLNESQCLDVSNVLSSSFKGKSYIEIIEELVRKLLLESTSILSMSSPRFNKLLRQLLIKYCTSNTSIEKKHLLCESALNWSKERKSVNLRHELELALMTLYYNTGYYRKAEEMATGLYKETKKLQDKEKTVKACLCLSKAYHAMGNISKARANITTAKTEALKIYTPPDLQGELDLQSGIMQVAEEKDMETAFSYFKEAATGFSVRTNRSKALKYMLLTKLLVNRPEEGEKAIRSQSHVEDIDEGVEAMLSITKAAVSCSLADFKKARERYDKELEDDLVVKGVLDQLYSKMLEKNLLNIITPYERMQISVVAEKIGLGREEVERRLSQMILDGEISAQLDHRDDCLYVYQPEPKDSVYDHALESVTQLDRTLSLLNRRVKQLL